MSKSLSRRSRRARLAAVLAGAATGVAGLLGAAAPSAHAQSVSPSAHQYSFVTLNDQLDPTFNQLLGINDHGEIAGYFGSGATGHPNQGYTLTARHSQAHFSNENFPGSVQTQVTAVNNDGETAGFWVDGNGNNFGFVDKNNTFISYRDPNTGTGTVNQILGLNDEGIAVGFYTDGNGVNHGFRLNTHSGRFSPVTVPDGSATLATGINDHGDITGFSTGKAGNVFSWLRHHGRVAEFEYPGSTNTTALGVNGDDEIVGVYVDSANAMHGFTVTGASRHGTFASIDDPHGVGTTTVNGVNDRGRLVGFYVDAAGNTDGFVAR